MSLAAPRNLANGAETFFVQWVIKTLQNNGLTNGIVDEKLGFELVTVICASDELTSSTGGDFNRRLELFDVEVGGVRSN